MTIHVNQFNGVAQTMLDLYDDLNLGPTHQAIMNKESTQSGIAICPMNEEMQVIVIKYQWESWLNPHDNARKMFSAAERSIE